MDKFSKILERVGLGHNFDISADVVMKNNQKFKVSFVVNSLNEKTAIKDAYKLLEEADYISSVKKMYEPKKIL
jgi:hypothetical protein